MNDTTNVLSWGDGKVTANLTDLPAASVFALAQRGFNHIFGNEMASYKKQLADKRKPGPDGKPTDEPVHDEAEIEELVNERRNEKLEAILHGTLGVRAAGAPRMSSFESLCRAIATERLVAKLAKAKLKLPMGERKAKDGTVKPAGTITLKTADGPKDFTREDLIANELNKYRDAIEAEAKRRQASADADGADVEDLV